MTSPPFGMSSTKRLTQATLAAAVVAVVILFAIVLPVEYGIDPLRTGQVLGLLRPADAFDEPAAGGADDLMTSVVTGPLARYGTPYRADRTTFELGPYEYLEYKYHLAEGASLLYSWEASAVLIHDLHGAPDAGGGNSSAEISHDKANRARASGSLVAPFAGMHGWYWENPGGTPVTIRLTSAGFYTIAIETRSNRTRRTHEVEPAPLPPVATTR